MSLLPARGVWAADPLVETAARAVVRVRAQQCILNVCQDTGVGSGVIIDPTGVILTAWHVTTVNASADPLKASTYATDFVIEMVEDLKIDALARYHAQLIAFDQDNDLALLRIDKTANGEPLPTGLTLPWLPIASEEPSTERLRIMGFPPSGGKTISYPILEQSGFDEAGALIKVQSQLSPGYSGGPVLVERAGRYEIVGVVIKARGENKEVGLIRNVNQLQQLEWLPNAEQVWATGVQVGTYPTAGEPTLYVSLDLHSLDFANRSGQVLAYVFDAVTNQPFTGGDPALPRSAKQQVVLQREFSATQFTEVLTNFHFSLPLTALGVPAEQLAFVIMLYDSANNRQLWKSSEPFVPLALTVPPPVATTPISIALAPPTQAPLTTTPDMRATQMAAAINATLTASAWPTPNPTVQQVDDDGLIATAVAATLAAQPTATPTATPTPNLAATQTAEVNRIETAIAATLTAQPTNTPDLAATQTRAAEFMQTAIAATLTARPTVTPRPTATPRPPPTATVRPPETTLGADGNVLRIAYAYGDVNDSDLRVADVESGGVTTIVGQSCDEAEPSWSPDAGFIIYHADCAVSYDIYLVRSDGGISVRLTNDDNRDEYEPDYSPDGRQIIYRVTPRKEAHAEDGELWVMNADGSNAYALGVIGRAPEWSPNGTQFTFMSNRSGIWNVYVYDLSTQRTLQLTQCSTNCRWPTWSPDGRIILFNTTAKANNTIADGLWVIAASGGDMTRITSGDNAGRASWSSTGLIAFNSINGIEYMREDSSGRRVLIASDDNWAPHWSK